MGHTRQNDLFCNNLVKGTNIICIVLWEEKNYKTNPTIQIKKQKQNKPEIHKSTKEKGPIGEEGQKTDF